MAFGSSSSSSRSASAGPPASPKQVAYLLALVQKAGYDGFKDARRPLELTQRQSNGRFTSKEASALIDRLLSGEVEEDTPERAEERRADALARADARQREERLSVLRGMPAELLAEELERRGWSATAPE